MNTSTMTPSTPSPFGALARPFVLVLGLGESGLAIARWCLRQGCRLRVADTREAPPKRAALDALAASTLPAPAPAFVGGRFAAALLDDDVALLAISPGLSPLDPDVAAVLAAAETRGVPVWSEFDFFVHALQAYAARETDAYRPKVLAVTGTNGKTTTCSLSAQLVARAGCSVALAGNISPALLDRLCEAEDAGALPDVWVIEASSFQLDTTQAFAPDAAALLNITQDHLDWHGSFEAYRAAKGRIFGEATVRVLCRDDAASLSFVRDDRQCITVGTDAPRRAGDFGIVEEHGIAWLAQALAAEDEAPAPSRRRKAAAAPEAGPLQLRRLMPVDALQIRGAHNASNALAALALASAIGLPLAPLLHGLREYRGEPHRVQWLATLAGVDYIDDSKGTNVGATLAALDGLARPTWLIAGGDGKGQDFAPLADAVVRWCRAVLLIGRDAERLAETLKGCAVPLLHCDSLEAAVAAAAEQAREGEIVLLSPACASLDMFKSYAHRAEVFREAVAERAADLGVVL